MIGRMLLSAGLFSCCFSAHATVVLFKDFSSVEGLKLNGQAKAQSSDVPGEQQKILRLTAAQGNQSGSAFSQQTVAAERFSTYFSFRIRQPGGGVFDCNTSHGADGLVFVIQPVSSSLGSDGNGLGYAGIPKSVAVEFDTWCNGGNNDPSSNHVGILLNGDVNHGPKAPFTHTVSPDFDNGKIWHVWIDYDGREVEVRANQTGSRPRERLLSRPVDLPKILGGGTARVGQAFIGFTAGTGAAWGSHEVLAWEYRDSYAPVGEKPAPPEKKPSPSQARGWKEVGYGGCDGGDTRKTRLAVPDDDLCDETTVGTVVVCNADHAGCTYKNLKPQQCKNGSVMGRLYVCQGRP